MKAKKALKRLAKIEALISEVTERVSKGSLQIQEALQVAKAAFVRVKEAVSSQASSGTAKKSAPIRESAQKTAPAPVPATAPVGKPAKEKPRKWSSAQREAAAERMRQLWAAKKRAEVKSQPKTASKAKKTAKAA